MEFPVSEVFVFIKETFPFPRLAGLNEGKKLSGEAPSPGFRLGFYTFCQKSRQRGNNKVVMQMAEFDRSPERFIGDFPKPKKPS